MGQPHQSDHIYIYIYSNHFLIPKRQNFPFLNTQSAMTHKRQDNTQKERTKKTSLYLNKREEWTFLLVDSNLDTGNNQTRYAHRKRAGSASPKGCPLDDDGCSTTVLQSLSLGLNRTLTILSQSQSFSLSSLLSTLCRTWMKVGRLKKMKFCCRERLRESLAEFFRGRGCVTVWLWLDVLWQEREKKFFLI